MMRQRMHGCTSALTGPMFICLASVSLLLILLVFKKKELVNGKQGENMLCVGRKPLCGLVCMCTWKLSCGWDKKNKVSNRGTVREVPSMLTLQVLKWDVGGFSTLFQGNQCRWEPSFTLSPLATADCAVPRTDILADLPLKHSPSLDQT